MNGWLVVFKNTQKLETCERKKERKTIVEWVLTAWSWLSADVISKSFKSSALNLAVDGTEDSVIHCFKKGQPCKAGSDQLQAQLSVLDEPNLPNPFIVITDSDVEKANDANLSVAIDPDDDDDIDVEL